MAPWIGTGTISIPVSRRSVDEVLALGAADRDDRARRQPVGGQRPGHVDALAAGIDPDAQGSHHLAPGERLDLDRPIDARD